MLPKAVAAVFFLTSFGLGYQVMKLQSIAPGVQTGLDAGGDTVDLFSPADAERSGDPEAEPRTLSWDKTYQLILHPAKPEDFASYRYVVAEAGNSGKIVKEMERKAPEGDESFSVTVWKQSLRPGRYQVLLYGVGQAAPVDQFEFKVEKR